MIRLGTTLMAIALLAAPAAAQEAVPKKEKMVCKTIKEIGSRLAKERVCKSRAEWDQISRETQKRHDDFGRTGSQGDLNGN